MQIVFGSFSEQKTRLVELYTKRIEKGTKGIFVKTLTCCGFIYALHFFVFF